MSCAGESAPNVRFKQQRLVSSLLKEPLISQTEFQTANNSLFETLFVRLKNLCGYANKPEYSYVRFGVSQFFS